MEGEAYNYNYNNIKNIERMRRGEERYLNLKKKFII
jgi:hypothetical protein